MGMVRQPSFLSALAEKMVCSMLQIKFHKLFKEAEQFDELGEIEEALFNDKNAARIAEWERSTWGKKQRVKELAKFRRSEKTIRHERMIQTQLYDVVSHSLCRDGIR
jgi:hypothetical protein